MKELVKLLVCVVLAIFLLPLVVKIAFGLLLLFLAFLTGVVLYGLIKFVEFWNKIYRKKESNHVGE